MTQRPFAQVDVFTAVPYLGNPLAVVLDGKGLSTAQMQAFTDWTNLSEATFVLPPTDEQADYAVRIFCPGRELPFAGHPTLGTCHAWLAAGGKPKGEDVVQECGVGLVKIARQGTRLAFAAPPRIRSGPLREEDVQLIAKGLGIDRADILNHAWCDNGPQWRGVMLASADKVLASMRFTDHHGQATEAYPFNPNGSPGGLTAVTTADGRFTAMMPHPERVFRQLQFSWTAQSNFQKSTDFSPWMRMWRNARRWVD
jgi:PhzF family phenazine biosynthesis protein